MPRTVEEEEEPIVAGSPNDPATWDLEKLVALDQQLKDAAAKQTTTHGKNIQHGRVDSAPSVPRPIAFEINRIKLLSDILRGREIREPTLSGSLRVCIKLLEFSGLDNLAQLSVALEQKRIK